MVLEVLVLMVIVLCCRGGEELRDLV